MVNEVDNVEAAEDQSHIGVASVDGPLHTPEDCIEALHKMRNKFFNVYTCLRLGLIERCIIREYPDHIYLYDRKTKTFTASDEKFNPEDDYIAFGKIFIEGEEEIGMTVLEYGTLSYFLFRLKQHTIYKLAFKLRRKK